MDHLKERLEVLEQRGAATERRMGVWRAVALASVAAGLLVVPLRPSTAKSQDTARGIPQRLAALEAAVMTLKSDNAVLKAKLEKVSIQEIDGAYSIVIDGANLHLRSGLGATNGDPSSPIFGQGTTNGAGNLIIGYNEVRDAGNDRSGSHNLVLGQRQNFTSFGGLVAGRQNTVSGPYASVSGGRGNTASVLCASVSGGDGNTASGPCASVSGGGGNTAGAAVAAVSGGAGNTASGVAASVSGGGENTAGSHLASVSGGRENTASGDASSVGGGETNIASGLFASIGGGRYNRAAGPGASVSGGLNRQAPSLMDWVAGGLFQDQ